MNFVVAVLAIVMLGATPAFSAGFEQVMVPDPSGAPLEVGIWYPSKDPVTSQRLGLFAQTVANDGAVAGRGLPLIVMSHGTGGSFEGHYDTALALAEAGFVVAAVTHTGDNYREQTQVGRLENRRVTSRYSSIICWRRGSTTTRSIPLASACSDFRPAASRRWWRSAGPLI